MLDQFREETKMWYTGENNEEKGDRNRDVLKNENGDIYICE
jgi:hypothetical protein